MFEKIMMRRILTGALVFVALGVAASTCALAQSDAAKLTEAGQRIARGSRSAIISLGISEGYFDEHFKLVSVVDAPGDRRVVWKFSIGEYETIVSDSLGFYTDERGRRVEVYSVANTLSAAHEIKRTIPRRRAERVMRACIGEYANGTVVYGAQGLPRRATLMLTASSIVKPTPRASAKERREKERREKERRERAERERRAGGKIPGRESRPAGAERDESEEERAPVYVGVVDLETGKCAKGRNVVTAPHR